MLYVPPKYDGVKVPSHEEVEGMRVIPFIVVILALFIAACGGDKPSMSPTKETVQLDGDYTTADAGYVEYEPNLPSDRIHFLNELATEELFQATHSSSDPPDYGLPEDRFREDGRISEAYIKRVRFLYNRRPGNDEIQFEPGYVSGDLDWFFSDVNKAKLRRRGGGVLYTIADFDLTQKT